MLDTTSRKYVQKSFDNLAKITKLININPNYITVLGFIMGATSAYLLSKGENIEAFVCLWLSGLFDVLDGTVARITKKSSNFGAFLDLTFDRIVEGLVILGLYIYKPEYIITYLIFYIGAMFNFTTFMVAGTLYKNKSEKSMHYDSGVIERTETFIVFSIIMIFPKSIPFVLTTFNILMIATGILRMFRVYNYESKK